MKGAGKAFNSEWTLASRLKIDQASHRANKRKQNKKTTKNAGLGELRAVKTHKGRKTPKCNENGHSAALVLARDPRFIQAYPPSRNSHGYSSPPFSSTDTTQGTRKDGRGHEDARNAETRILMLARAGLMRCRNFIKDKLANHLLEEVNI